MRKWFVALPLAMWLTTAEGATFTVTTMTDSGPGSLRKALEAAITSVPPVVVNFAIPGSAPFVISPTTQLPGLYGSVTLDGSTQSGFQLNSPSVVIDGLGSNFLGILVLGDSNLVRGIKVQNLAPPASTFGAIPTVWKVA